MDASYEQGTLLWYWFEYWFVAFGMFTTLLLAVLVAVRSTREPRDLLPSFFMVAAVLAALPLTFIRLGVDIASANHLTVGYMSLAGVLGSIVVGIPQLIGIGCVSDKKWKDRTSEEFKMTETICDYFDGMISEVSLATEECSRATLLAAEKLPPILHLITTYPDPRTRGSRVPGSGVIRGRGSGERETTASSLAGKEESSRKEDDGGQGKDGPAGAIAQGGNGR